MQAPEYRQLPIVLDETRSQAGSTIRTYKNISLDQGNLWGSSQNQLNYFDLVSSEY